LNQQRQNQLAAAVNQAQQQADKLAQDQQIVARELERPQPTPQSQSRVVETKTRQLQTLAELRQRLEQMTRALPSTASSKTRAGISRAMRRFRNARTRERIEFTRAVIRNDSAAKKPDMEEVVARSIAATQHELNELRAGLPGANANRRAGELTSNLARAAARLAQAERVLQQAQTLNKDPNSSGQANPTRPGNAQTETSASGAHPTASQNPSDRQASQSPGTNRGAGAGGGARGGTQQGGGGCRWRQRLCAGHY